MYKISLKVRLEMNSSVSLVWNSNLFVIFSKYEY